MQAISKNPKIADDKFINFVLIKFLIKSKEYDTALRDKYPNQANF